MSQSTKKMAAALAAVDYVEPDTVIGVGTGSTVNCFIQALEERGIPIAAAVSSSDASTSLLRQAGVRVMDLNEIDKLALYVDGADESNPELELIKGGGGALTREKIVAEAAGIFVCIVDDSKLVPTLGAFPLPIEVIPMAAAQVSAAMTRIGGTPQLRSGFLTDNGNQILDVHDLVIENPRELEHQLNQIPGIVTVGIFARRPADVLLVGGNDGVKVFRK